MLILGVDCSSKQGSVAILKDGLCMYQCVYNGNMTHSQNLLSIIKNALDVCQLTIDDIDLFAITVGPGSFTGLRIGIATIKGFAIASNKKCVGVSSLKALAACYNFNGIIIPCFDARRNQIYCNISDNGKIIADDMCVLVDELESFIANCKKNIFFVGDGKNLCYNKYKNLNNVIYHNIETPCIALGASLLASNMMPVSHFEISPSYLRLSQAERELKEKLNGSIGF